MCPDFLVHVECREAFKCGVDVALRSLFPLIVTLFVKWEWGMVRDGVPDAVFCEFYGGHAGFVVVECGAEVGVVPLEVFG